jgi:hypothetical protein
VGSDGMRIASHRYAARRRSPAWATLVRKIPVMRTFAWVLPSALVVGALATTASASTRLLGTVSLRSGVTLMAANGRKASPLKPGVYLLTVRDRARRGNFHLVGLSPVRLDRKTGMRFTGNVTWKLSLRRGDYRYFSDSNAARGRLLRVR